MHVSSKIYLLIQYINSAITHVFSTLHFFKSKIKVLTYGIIFSRMVPLSIIVSHFMMICYDGNNNFIISKYPFLSLIDKQSQIPAQTLFHYSDWPKEAVTSHWPDWGLSCRPAGLYPKGSLYTVSLDQMICVMKRRKRINIPPPHPQGKKNITGW